MKLYSKIIAILLVFAMLSGFAACSGGSGDGSVADSSLADSSEESSVEESSESDEERAAKAYQLAVEALSAKTDIKQSVKSATTRSIGIDAFKVEEEITAIYKGLGTDGITAHISEKNTSGSKTWRAEKYYADGKYIYNDPLTEELYYKELSTEELEDLVIPVVLLDSELYDSLLFDGEDESGFVLSGATAVESWLAPEYAKVLSSEAKIKTDGKGEITQYQYTVSYTQGPASYEAEYTVDLSAPEEEITLPEAEGVQNDNIELIDVFKLANLATTSMIAFEYDLNLEMLSQPGGIYTSTAEEVYLYGTDSKDFIVKTYSDIGAQYSNGREEQMSVEQDYKDGKLTTTVNGEKKVINSTMEEILDSIIEKDKNLNLTNPDISIFESCEVSYLGNYLYISYTLNEDGSKLYEDVVSEAFFDDVDAIDNAADSFAPEKSDGYISIDVDTMLITACGIDFECIHTLNNTEYKTGIYASVSYTVASACTYKEITGELPEEKEPEDKPTPLFYKVTAPDGGVMYVLGTIHVGDSATAYLPEEVYTALENSDALAVEFDLIDFEERIETDENLMAVVGESYYYTDDSLITDHIEDELYKEARKYVLASGAPGYLIDYMTPSAWSEMIEGVYKDSYTALSTEYGVDYRLLRIAKEKGMEIVNVESAESQYGMSALFTDDIHRVLLLSSISGTRNEYIETMQEMYDLWCEGDEAKLIEYIRNEEVPEDVTEAELAAIEQYNKMLGADRDEKMIEKAKEYMASGETVFFAVGLAHIVSETGLVDALRAEGYTVELVSYK